MCMWYYFHTDDTTLLKLQLLRLLYFFSSMCPSILADQSRLKHVRQRPGRALHQTVPAEEEDLAAQLQGEVVRSHPGKSSLLWLRSRQNGSCHESPFCLQPMFTFSPHTYVPKLPDSSSIWQAETKRSERISRPGEDQVRGDGPAGAKCAAGADVCIPGEDCGSFTRRSFTILRHQHRCSSFTFPFPMCLKTCISAALEEGERLTWDPMSMTVGQRKFAQVAQIDKVWGSAIKGGKKNSAVLLEVDNVKVKPCKEVKPCPTLWSTGDVKVRCCLFFFFLHVNSHSWQFSVKKKSVNWSVFVLY